MTLHTVRTFSAAAAALLLLLAALSAACPARARKRGGGEVYSRGGMVRMNPAVRSVALVFTAADTADGADTIASALRRYGIRGHFFFTGKFFEKFPAVVTRLLREGHYVGCHGYSHLLYLPWDRSDTMLVTRTAFEADMRQAYRTMARFGIRKRKAWYFIPPYEHYNDTVAAWARDMGLTLINNTPGTLTYGDYTTPDMPHYYSSDFILGRVLGMAAAGDGGINGHLLLMHLGTSGRRTDKFYNRLPELIEGLTALGYTFADLSQNVPKPQNYIRPASR